MRDFHRERPEFAQCGLNCLLCPMHLGGYCPGCGGGEGNQSCALARCAQARKTGEFCSHCPEFPCERYRTMLEYDSFIPHSRMTQDLERAEKMGLDAYLQQLEERRAILDRLLAGWNDGRRKSFYCLAVYLLDLDGLRRAFAELQAASVEKTDVKEKSLTAVAILQAEAQKQGVTLKLNKKPKEK